jgi:hypothetical protein
MAAAEAEKLSKLPASNRRCERRAYSEGLGQCIKPLLHKGECEFEADDLFREFGISRPGRPEPSDEAKRRKAIPIARGFMDYFPDAIKEIAACSLACHGQHYGPDVPLHWDKTVSTDQADSAMRHFLDRGTRDNDGQRHSTKAAWRMLAYLQLEIENDR